MGGLGVARRWDVGRERFGAVHERPGTYVSAETSADADPDDALYELGERCAEAYMQADALHYRAMTLLVEFHHQDGWKDTGFSSTADWLAWRVSIKPGAARERVRTALALEKLPETSRAMANGELSFTKVRALTRVATAENEDALLELARSGSAANLERVVRGWKQLDRRSEVDAEQLRYRARRCSAFVDDDGMVVLRARLDPEAGAMLMRAIEAAGDALFKDDPEEDPARRRADAVGLIAERALAAGFGADDDVPISGSRADRTQVVLHVDEATLSTNQDPGRSELEDRTRVSAETSRRIACDTGVVRMTHDSNGQPSSVGRRTRTVPPALRRALEARDRGCRFPGCGLRFTDAHHVRHWADGGETSLRNLVLLCRRHHRHVHEGGVRVCIDRDQKVVFFAPNGAALAPSPRYRGNATADGAVGVSVTGDGVTRESVRGERFAGEGLGGERVGGGRACVGDDRTDARRRATGSARRPTHPAGRDGAARHKRDSLIPWPVEARALDALEAGPATHGA